MIPDSYLPSIYNVNYSFMRDNGIKYLVFDIDCTILPFDDINVTRDNDLLFEYMKSLGFKCAFCSSGSRDRVKSVADKLGINYMYRAKKPNVKFEELKELFDDDFRVENSVFIGESLYFDMYNAGKLNMNKILVDMVIDGFNFKLFPNEFIQAAMFKRLREYGLEEKKYYKGNIEK